MQRFPAFTLRCLGLFFFSPSKFGNENHFQSLFFQLELGSAPST
jgi:hypothetical protein